MMDVTFEKSYTFADRSKWGPGPWDGEPDKVQWTDEATGMACLAVRNRGHWCGYAGVTEGHPWFGVGYSGHIGESCEKMKAEDYCLDHRPDVLIEVHGGLTFAGGCQEDKEKGICHVPKPGEADAVWWFGFDCAHSGDTDPETSAAYATAGVSPLPGAEYRTLEYVVEQVTGLAKQLAEVV